MAIKRALLALIAAVFMVVARSSPALAQGEGLPYIEGLDYQRVKCAQGVTGTCFRILSSRDITGTSAFAREFNTTPQAIRADNPTSTIPLCCRKPGKCEPLRLPGLQTRTSNENWKNYCPDEERQAVYIVPGTTIVISGKPRLTFNQQMEGLKRLQTTDKPEDAVDVAKALAPNVKDGERIVVLPPPPPPVEESNPSAEPPTPPAPNPPPPPPIMTRGEFTVLVGVLAAIGFVAWLVWMVIRERQMRRTEQRAHEEWKEAKLDQVERLQEERDRLKSHLDAVLERGEEMIGSTGIRREESSDDARVGRFIFASDATLIALDRAAAQIKLDPKIGAGAALNALADANQVLTATNEELAKTKLQLESLRDELDEGLRALYKRFTNRACFKLTPGTVRRAVDDLADAIHRSIEWLSATTSGEDPTRDLESFDLTDIARISGEFATLNAQLAEYCGDEAPPALMAKFRLIMEGQEGAVASYRAEVQKKAGEIAGLRRHLNRLEAEISRRNNDPPEDGPDAAPKTMRPSGLPVPPSTEESDEEKWAHVGQMSVHFVRALRNVTYLGRHQARYIEIKRPDHLWPLYRVYKAFRCLLAFVPQINGSSLRGSRPFTELVGSDEAFRALQHLLTSAPSRPPAAPNAGLAPISFAVG
jgi:hypothetical protein